MVLFLFAIDTQFRGLGAVLVEKFAAEGANIVVNYVSSKDQATEVAEKVKKEYGVQAHVVQAVSDHLESGEALLSLIKLLGGRRRCRYSTPRERKRGASGRS